MGIFVPILYFMNLEIKDLVHICTNINMRTHMHTVGVSRTNTITSAEKKGFLFSNTRSF